MLSQVCHKCNMPYEDCVCKQRICKKCGNPEEDLGYCCNEEQRNEPTPEKVVNDGVFIQRVEVGGLEAVSKCEPVNTVKPPQYNANEHELNFVESKKEDWVDLGAHYRHSFMGHKIDVYRVLEIFDVTDPVAQHIIKKLLRGENKGHTMNFVWNEVFQACDRKKEMMEEDSA